MTIDDPWELELPEPPRTTEHLAGVPRDTGQPCARCGAVLVSNPRGSFFPVGAHVAETFDGGGALRRLRRDPGPIPNSARCRARPELRGELFSVSMSETPQPKPKGTPMPRAKASAKPKAGQIVQLIVLTGQGLQTKTARITKLVRGSKTGEVELDVLNAAGKPYAWGKPVPRATEADGPKANTWQPLPEAADAFANADTDPDEGGEGSGEGGEGGEGSEGGGENGD